MKHWESFICPKCKKKIYLELEDTPKDKQWKIVDAK